MTETNEPAEQSSGEESLFRQEALDHHLAARGEGNVLRIAPRWTRWAYPALVVMVGLGLIYCVVGQIHEYAAGPAIIEVANASDVSSPVAGTVVAVAVAPGQRVREGEVLAQFNDEVQRAEYDRLQAAYRLHLVNRLRDRTDQTAEQAMISLKTQLALAKAHLEERSLVAPADGVITDVRIRVGQVLRPGQSAMGLVTGDPQLEVVAMLPGHYRPLLEPGLELRLELTGFAYAYQELTISHVSDEVVGPTVARNFLRPKMAEAVVVDGPVVLVRGSLSSLTFTADGEEHQYIDGQVARAEAKVRSESILISLVPGLEALFEKFDG